MKNKELLGILKLVQPINASNWNEIMYINKLICEGKIEILEKQWCDYFKDKNKELYNLDLSKLDTWSTYEDCMDVSYSLIDDKLLCDITIWDGEIMHGSRTKQRFKVKLKMQESHIKHIEERIIYNFNVFAEDIYDLYLEGQKKKWVEEFKLKYVKTL